MATRGAHRWWGRGVWMLAALTLLFVAVHTQQRVLLKQETRDSPQINDFSRWLVLVPRLWADRVDLVSDNFPNPPVTMLVIVPFTKVSPATAQLLWVCAKGLMAAGVFVLGRRMVERAGVKLAAPAVALIVAVWVGPVLGDLQEGNTNLLMLLPLVAGLAVTQSERRAADWLGGLLVAMAIAIKVTPLAFVPYALVRRRWTWALAMSVGLVAWLVLVPGLVFGWHQNLRWLGQWAGIMIEPYAARGQIDLGGQSIPSLLTRVLRHVPGIVWTQHGVTHTRYLNLVDLPEPVVNWISRGVLLALALAGVLWVRRPLATLRSPRYVAEIGVVGVFMLWASQRTWVPHYVTLILALFAAGMVASDPAEPRRARHRAWLALAVAAGLMALTGDAQRLVPGCGHCAKTVGLSFWASAALVAAVVRARTTGPAAVPAGGARPLGPSGV